jgi:GTP-binding protein
LEPILPVYFRSAQDPLNFLCYEPPRSHDLRVPGIIAIVGRPNVGKSALFNCIVRKRVAIVHDEAGVTRDRISVETEWLGQPYTLIDTGGIGLDHGEKTQDIIIRATVDQVDVAIEAAEAIIFVVNVQDGVMPLDREVAARLRDTGRPVFVAINKVDHYKAEPGIDAFADLGFDAIFPISAIHARGIDLLVGAAFKELPTAESPAETDEDGEETDTVEAEKILKISIVGRPNVGKSSIINALTDSDRVIVSDIPGTTRDAVDVPFEVETDGVRQSYLLIDTAGVRKKRRVDSSVEFFSVKRTESAIARSDIVVLVIDAEDGITMQDKKIADKITEEKKACILVVNKWDLMAEDVVEARKEQTRERKLETKEGKRRREGEVEAPMTTLVQFGQWVQEKMFFLYYAPVIFTSAKSGFHLDRLLESIRYVSAQLRQRVPTSLLNRAIRDTIARHPAPTDGNSQLKFFYATQTDNAPLTILMFVNRKDLFTPVYEKYLAKSLRKSFGFEGCPLFIVAKARPKKVESIRSRRPGTAKPERQSRRKKTTAEPEDWHPKKKPIRRAAPPKKASLRGSRSKKRRA